MNEKSAIFLQNLMTTQMSPTSQIYSTITVDI